MKAIIATEVKLCAAEAERLGRLAAAASSTGSHLDDPRGDDGREGLAFSLIEHVEDDAKRLAVRLLELGEELEAAVQAASDPTASAKVVDLIAKRRAGGA